MNLIAMRGAAGRASGGRNHTGRRRLLPAGLVLTKLGQLTGCELLPPQAAVPKIPRIDYLDPRPEPSAASYGEAFRQGLNERGYVEGQNIAVPWRFAECREEQAIDLVEELPRLPTIPDRGDFAAAGGLLVYTAK